MPTAAALTEDPAHDPDESPGSRTYGLEFGGSGLSLFLIALKNLLLTLVTLGIYMPWARVERRKYIWQNLAFHGQPLRFTGTGSELFVGYLKVGLAYLAFIAVPQGLGLIHPTLRIVSAVILTFALLALLPVAIFGARRYLLSRTTHRGIRFGVTGSPKRFALSFYGNYLLTVVTLGLWAPVMSNRLHRIITEQSQFGSEPFRYTGEDGTIWKLWMVGLLLTVLTLGVYFPWYQAKLLRYKMENTHFSGASGRSEVTGRDLFVIYLLLLFGTTLTVGLAAPWIAVYTLDRISQKLSFVGQIDFHGITQRDTGGDAAAEGLADALDVAIGF
jgi:uncharacterized membrane protein YjgN (DUF898 family)